MGERKGVNKYYPPDYDPSKGGLNKFQGTHALRERARKLHLGILIIRFEMPYNIWCEGCNKHIGMGVRYNAEKKKAGMYYSTPIYQFRMKCHLCDNYFEIKTDPANLDYEIVSGARRQEKRWDPTENMQVVPEDKEVTRKMAVDAMFKLEHGVGDKVKSQEVDPVLQELEEFQAKRWHDDYASNKTLRAAMRVKRAKAQTQAARDASYHLSVPLLPPNEEDIKTAKLLQFTQSKSSDQLRDEKRAVIDAQSVFAKLRTKKVPQTAKKAFAHQSLRDIVTNSQKNFNNFKNNFGSQRLGIIPRKVGTQSPSEKLNDEFEGEFRLNSHSGDLHSEENCLSSVALPVSSIDPHITPIDSAYHDTACHTNAHCSSLSTSAEDSGSVLDSQIQHSILQHAPKNSSLANTSTDRVQCLVNYDLSASDSDDSFH